MSVVQTVSRTAEGGADSPPDLLAGYGRVRAASETLADRLTPEDQVVQSMPDASPTKWHLAHTSWFFETFLLAPHLPGYAAFHPDFAYLFNSYYVQVGPRYPRPSRGMLTRPPLQEVRAYRRHVDAGMQALLGGGAAAQASDVAALTALGLHHEQQHQELILTDLLHALSCNPLKPAYNEADPPAAREAPEQRWQAFEGGLYEMGHAGEGFAFDNETPRHKVWLEPFRLASRPVCNSEWLAFMQDGGYRRPDLWLSDGWAAAEAEAWEAPLYWEEREDGWWSFGLTGMQPVDGAAPVCHVSYYEADAFARWSGRRLPREAEWEVAAAACPVSGNMLGSGLLRPAPAAQGAGELQQIFGDVWEWTQSPYAPYPGYRAPTGAVGEYNGKFMCNQMVLRGGSCATPAGHVRASYRNFFYPYQRWQFSGLRLAEDA